MKISNEFEQTIKNIYHKYASFIHFRCMKILKSEDDAWDVTQDVFMKLMNSYHTIKNKQALLAWMIRTSTNQSISVLRKKREIAFNDNVLAIEGRDSNHEQRTLNRTILKKLFKLGDKKTIEIIVYTYIDGYTQEEIAEITGMGESTIRKYLTRFRRKSQQWKSTQDDFEY